jgi:hypothetical protein
MMNVEPVNRLGLRWLLRRAIVAMLVPVLGAGCATPAIWDNAGTTTVDTPVIDAVITELTGRRVLVVTYAGPWSERSTLAVPLGENGRPAWPFGLAGSPKTVGAALSTIPASQRDAIVAAGQSLRPGGPPKGATIVTVDPTATENAAGESCRSFADTAGDATITVAAYRIFARDRIAAVSLPTSNARSQPVPDGVVLVLVPTKAARPGEQLLTARARAVALTPFTVPLDLACASLVIPMLIFLVLTGYHDC